MDSFFDNNLPVVYALLGIIILIILIAYFKFDTFISFILVSIGIGLVNGMPISSKDPNIITIGKSIQNGIGGTLGELILIIGFGAMLGKLVAESGAAQQITNKLLIFFGEKYLQLGLAFAGFVIGIPLFYNAGFIIVVPLIFSIAISTRLPLLYLAIPMLSALSVAHGFLPPHPSPAAISKELNADVGLVLIYGIGLAIPSILIAGVMFGKTLKKYNIDIDLKSHKPKEFKEEELPNIWISVAVALMPVLILTITAIVKSFVQDNLIVNILSESYIGMLISILIAIYLLGIKRNMSMEKIGKLLEDSFKSIAVILLIIGGSGALKQILKDTETSQNIGRLFSEIHLNPLILGWLIAGVIRVCVGSATVAGLTVVGILGPMIANHPEINSELMVLSIGAGSLMLSHINDGGFWLFKEYFNLSIKQTLKTWTVMETLVSVIGLIGVLLLDQII
jgi:Gnt-I system high-affinity gluconate transporter